MKEEKNSKPESVFKEVIDLNEFCKDNPNAGFDEVEVEICDEKLLSELIEQKSNAAKVWRPLNKKK